MILDKLRELFTSSEKQTTWVYCPRCDNELTKGENCEVLLNDPESHLVIYECLNCGAKPKFDFEAPTPLHLGYRTEEEVKQ